MLGIDNSALPFFYRKEHPADFSVVRHVLFPAIGTIALLPALFAPVLPFLPQFSKAGPVAWQLVATVPLTFIWAIAGVVVAMTMSKSRAERAARLGADQDLVAGHPGFGHVGAGPSGAE